jgi:hypothetical protein
VKIAVIGAMFEDSFADNVIDSLRSMGHEADALGSTYRSRRSKVDAVVIQLVHGSQAASLRLQSRMVARATDTHYDVVIALDATLLRESVDRIRRNGSEVALWFGDRVTGHYVARQAKARLFRSTGVVLNTLHQGEIASMNCRLFEAAGCGAAILTKARPDLEPLFEVGPEVASYDSFDVLADRARWMLDDPAAARAMRERAATRAHAHHTYEPRLEQLLAALS